MITTVLGDIQAKDLGVTSPHEHVFIDMRNCVAITGNEPPEFYGKVDITNRALVFAQPYAILDNALISDFDMAVQEMLWFKEAGGNTIIDCTPDEIGRDPEALRQVSLKSGVNIVAGCGNYYHMAHPEFVHRESVYELADRMYKDLTVGINGTDIKAGIIGEIGTSAVMSDDEKKVLHAAGMVGKQTDKPIHVHTDLYTENGFEVIDILESEGVEAKRICIDHIDVLLRYDYVTKLLKRGVFIEFDNFGKEFYCSKDRRFAYDLERIEFLKRLIDDGFSDRILVSNDICLKTMLRSFGGNGYAHILKTVADMARENGFYDKYHDILTKNTQKFFCE